MPTIIAPEDGLSPAAYDFERLKAEGFVASRSELSRLIRQAGFPAPIKASPAKQAGSLYHGPSVRAWFLARAQAANFLPKQAKRQ